MAPAGLAHASGATGIGAGFVTWVKSHGLRDAWEMPALPRSGLNPGKILYKVGPSELIGGRRWGEKLLLPHF